MKKYNSEFKSIIVELYKTHCSVKDPNIKYTIFYLFNCKLILLILGRNIHETMAKSLLLTLTKVII